jgi:DNA-binding IclR family transcriptional regulator
VGHIVKRVSLGHFCARTPLPALTITQLYRIAVKTMYETNGTGIVLDKPMSRERRGGIQVITRAAMILRALEDKSDGLSLGEIAARVDLARSTVQRIVAALAEEQLLTAATPKSRVKLGPSLVRLARSTNVEIEQIAHPIMESCSRKINETVDLSVVQGKSATFIDQVLGTHRLRAVSAIGERFPLHSTACGKALLAMQPDARLEKLLNGDLERFTENTITDPETLRAQLAALRNGETVEDIEEYSEGICAVGIAFADPLDRIFAISIPVPTNRFMRNREKLRNAVRECRDQILSALGDARAAP